MEVTDRKVSYSKLLVGKTPREQKQIDLILNVTMPAIASATEAITRLFSQHTFDTARSREVFETNLTIQILKAVEESIAKNIPIYVNGHIKRLSEKVDQYQAKSEAFMLEAKPMLEAFKNHEQGIKFNTKILFSWSKVLGAVAGIIVAVVAILQFIIRPILSALK